MRVAAGLARRREILGIVDWRVAQCEKHGVELRTNVYAEADDVLREGPDVVDRRDRRRAQSRIFCVEGAEHATTSWDILTGAVKPAANVIVYDDNGAHPGVSVAEFCARAGANVDYMTPERTLGARRRLHQLSALSARVLAVRRRRDAQPAAGAHAARGQSAGRRVPSTNTAQARRARRRPDRRRSRRDAGGRSLFRAEAGLAQSRRGRSGGAARRAAADADPQCRTARYQLFRIGDAVASRNIHAAVYDALRLVCVL